MVRAHLYVEGGESKEDQIRCRRGFRKLLEKADFAGRMPRLSACGSRTAVFSDFKTAHASQREGDYNAMLVDSEEPMVDREKAWEHLERRDHWQKPEAVVDEQVLFMTTCMETWVVADRTALRAHYGQGLQETALPPLTNLEDRNRHEVYDRLTQASRRCTNAYSKGKRSFEVLEKLDPNVLRLHLPSFVRVERILTEKL